MNATAASDPAAADEGYLEHCQHQAWIAPVVILEALIPGRMQSYASTVEVADKLRERAVKIVSEGRKPAGRGTVTSPG